MATATELLQVPIAGMTCEHCVRTVSQALSALPGVESARVDLATARAEVEVDPSRTDRGALRKAIESAGYRVPGGGRRGNCTRPGTQSARDDRPASLAQAQASRRPGS